MWSLAGCDMMFCIPKWLDIVLGRVVFQHKLECLDIPIFLLTPLLSISYTIYSGCCQLCGNLICIRLLGMRPYANSNAKM